MKKTKIRSNAGYEVMFSDWDLYNHDYSIDALFFACMQELFDKGYNTKIETLKGIANEAEHYLMYRGKNLSEGRKEYLRKESLCAQLLLTYFDSEKIQNIK